MLFDRSLFHKRDPEVPIKICVCRDRRPVSWVHHSDLLSQPDLSEVDEVGTAAPPFLSFPYPSHRGEGEKFGGIAVREPALAGHLRYLRAQWAPKLNDVETT